MKKGRDGEGVGEEGIFIKAQIGLLCDNLLCAPYRGAVICSLGVCDREPAHQTRLKFCSAGEALVWQSFILGREQGGQLPASPAAVPAGGWTRGIGAEAMHAACPRDGGQACGGSSRAHIKGDLGAGTQPGLSRGSFPKDFFSSAKRFSLNRSLPPQQGTGDGDFPAIPPVTPGIPAKPSWPGHIPV